MSDFGAEVVTVTPPVQRDSFGDPIPGSGTPEDVEGCTVYPRGASTEQEFRASTVIDGITILMPGERDIDPAAKLTWRGKDYDVVGEPGIWPYLDGEIAGTQINAKRAQG